eukprot:15487311-Heterocapsa_arctica.AAC.1
MRGGALPSSSLCRADTPTVDTFRRVSLCITHLDGAMWSVPIRDDTTLQDVACHLCTIMSIDSSRASTM